MISEIFRTYITGGLLSPTSFFGILLIISAILLWMKKFRAGKILVTLAAVLFVLMSTAFMKQSLFSFLETDPAPLPQDYDYVVVLGARTFPHKTHPISSQISPSLLARLTYGVELTLKKPGSILVVTGNGAGEVPEADLMKEFALRMGLPEERVIAEKESMNTKEHPVYLRPIVQDRKFLIVTSAYHMKRALKNFRAHKLEGFPAPTDYRNKSEDLVGKGSFIMRGENLSALDRWMTEMYSTIWTHIRMALN